MAMAALQKEQQFVKRKTVRL